MTLRGKMLRLGLPFGLSMALAYNVLSYVAAGPCEYQPWGPTVFGLATGPLFAWAMHRWGRHHGRSG